MRRAPKSRSSVQADNAPVLPNPPKHLEIIRGIMLTVTGRELCVRLTERIRWHRQRGDNLIEQIIKLGEFERGASDVLGTAYGRYESPRASLEKRLREHQERATFLKFIHDHLTSNALYRLDTTDLRMTEILPDRPW